jgi:hypothetical protein
MSNTLYLARTNKFNPNDFYEAMLALGKLIPNYGITYHNREGSYQPNKVKDARALFVANVGNDFTIGTGVYNEINKSKAVFILYKRVMDGLWQIYEIKKLRKKEPRYSSSSNYAEMYIGDNVTNIVRESYSLGLPILEENVLVEIDLTYESRRAILLTRKSK